VQTGGTGLIAAGVRGRERAETPKKNTQKEKEIVGNIRGVLIHLH